MAQAVSHIKNTPEGTFEWHGYGSVPHREDGPAIIFPNGDREWWRDGELHRDDGPAVERADGSREFWRNGKPWPGGPAEMEKIEQRKAQERAAEAERELVRAREKAQAGLRARPRPKLKP